MAIALFSRTASNAVEVTVSALLLVLSLPTNVAVASCNSGRAAGGASFGLAAPANLLSLKRTKFYATAYIDALTNDTNGVGTVPIKDSNGKPTGRRLTHFQWCIAADEGTTIVTLPNGRKETYNIANTNGSVWTNCASVFTKPSYKKKLPAIGRTLFRRVPTDAPYGLGDGEKYRLIPFRSFAVDKTGNGFAKIGDVLFIPKLKGACVTELGAAASEHDGYVIAVDTGGAISGEHMDFFEGPQKSDDIINALASDEKTLLDAYIVTDPQIIAELTKVHVR